MKWKRRAVLRRVAGLTGAIAGSGATATRALAGGRQVDTSLPTGVTLFDLNDDGRFAVTVERAPAKVRDDAHRQAIHVTSGGRATVDFAVSAVEPANEVTLGDLNRLAYDYYEGADNADADGAAPPGQTFVVVENADGRHGAYLTYGGDGPRGKWLTHDVLARMRGDTDGTSRWFEYTAIEDGYEGETFDDFVGRFGTDARLVRVGVGLGSAVNPVVLDAFYANLTINDRTQAFPTSVAKRVSQASRSIMGLSEARNGR